jgi:hypothetical protein
MTKFLIEVPHDPEVVACAQAVQIFLQTGSHFLTNADWGCADGEHYAWLTLEVESKEDARSVLPSSFRSQARIVRLNKYTMQEIEEVLRDHGGQLVRLERK